MAGDTAFGDGVGSFWIYAMRASVHACDKQQQQHGMKRECIRITVPLDAAGVKHDAGAGYYRCGGG